MAHVARSVREQDVEQVGHDALLEAWETEWVPGDEAALRSWLRTITDRIVADFVAKRTRRAAKQGPMPSAPTPVDEAGEPIDDSDDASHKDIDPSFNPETDSLQARGLLLRRWLEKETTHNPRDRETFEMMLEWAESEKTYEDIARERKMTTGAVTARLFKFRNDYGPRFQKYRDRVVPLLWLGGFVIAAVVVAAVYALWRREPPATILPGPPLQWVTPSASAPPVEPFDQALPTTPPSGVPAVPEPRGPDKPRLR